MPKGQYCQYESEYFDQADFEVIAGQKIHRVEPRHRTDGVLTKTEGEKVVPVADQMLAPPPPEAEE
jgi:hypothetical protein